MTIWQIETIFEGKTNITIILNISTVNNSSPNIIWEIKTISFFFLLIDVFDFLSFRLSPNLLV